MQLFHFPWQKRIDHQRCNERTGSTVPNWDTFPPPEEKREHILVPLDPNKRLSKVSRSSGQTNVTRFCFLFFVRLLSLQPLDQQVNFSPAGRTNQRTNERHWLIINALVLRNGHWWGVIFEKLIYFTKPQMPVFVRLGVDVWVFLLFRYARNSLRVCWIDRPGWE